MFMCRLVNISIHMIPFLNIFFSFYEFVLFSRRFESSCNMTLTISSKICSFGKQVIEKIEVSDFLLYK